MTRRKLSKKTANETEAEALLPRGNSEEEGRLKKKQKILYQGRQERHPMGEGGEGSSWDMKKGRDRESRGKAGEENLTTLEDKGERRKSISLCMRTPWRRASGAGVEGVGICGRAHGRRWRRRAYRTRRAWNQPQTDAACLYACKICCSPAFGDDHRRRARVGALRCCRGMAGRRKARATLAATASAFQRGAGMGGT